MRPRVGLVVLALGVAACGGPLADAKSDFKKGHYAEAKEELVRAEDESRAWTD